MRKPDKFRLVLALFLAFALVAASCGDDDDDASGGTGASVDGTLKFGALLPQTGDLADYGPGMLGGVKLAVQDINDAGGVLGGDVELVDADSATDPDQANQQAEQLINTENVDAILGAAGSTVSLLGVIEPTVGAGRIECSGSNTSPAFTTYDDKGLYFRTAPSDAFQSKLLAKTIAADGYTNVAIVYRSDDYGQAFADLTKTELENAGITVPQSVGYNVDNPDFDADASTVAGIDGLQAVVVIAFPDEGGNLLKAMIEQGVGPADVAHYYTDGLASADLPSAVAPDNVGIFDGTKGTRPGASEEPTEFNQRLADETGASQTTFAANMYDCAVSIALGAVVAGTDDPEAIAKTLQDVTSGGEKCSSFEECLPMAEAGDDFDYDGITGFDYNADGEPAQGSYEVWQFQNGDIEVINSEVVTG